MNKTFNKEHRWMHGYAAAVLARYTIFAGTINWDTAKKLYRLGYTPDGALAGMSPADITNP